MAFKTQIILHLLFFLLSCEIVSAQQIQTRPPQWNSEASLNDVHFLDHDIGVAVGDHGTILRTTDGGRHWRKVANRVHADLESVHFADENNGWAVGGFSYAQVSPQHAKHIWSPNHQGIVLKTTNGGITWKQVRTESLPALRDVYFSDAQNGWAIGFGSHYFPSGVFVSTDGGQTWSGAPDQRLHGWKRMAAGPHQLMAIDDRSMIADITQQKPDNASMLLPRKVELNDIALTGDTGMAVGPNATVVLRRSSSNGNQSRPSSTRKKRSWTYQQTPIPSSFQLETVAGSGNTFWMAGTPGTYVFSYNSQTGKWYRYNTGSKQSIHRIFFVDEKRGWAVGSLGMILQTRDGGKTWQKQRGHEKRLGMLVVVDNLKQTPFELLAKYNAEEGYLTGVIHLKNGHSTLDQQLAAKHACSQLGNNVFIDIDRPTPTKGDGLTRDRQIRSLAQIIRTFRPESLVGTKKLSDIVINSVQVAKDKKQLPSLITDDGLPTWEVPRTLTTTDPAGNFDIVIGASQFLVHSGKLLSDAVSHSRAISGQALLGGRPTHLATLIVTGSTTSRTAQLLSGRQPSICRQVRTDGGHITQMRKVVQKKARFEQMMSWQATATNHRSWQAELQKFIDQLDDDTAPIWLKELANQYWSKGDQQSAITTIENLVSRYPNHWIADRSILWLLNRQVSSEALKLQPQEPSTSANDQLPVKKASYQTRQKIETNVDGTQRVVWVPVPEKELTEKPEPTTPLAIQRMEKAKRLIGLVAQRNTNFSNQPIVELAIANVRRKLENGQQDTAVYRKLLSSPTTSNALQFIARRESQLSKSKPKLVASTQTICQRLENKPFLDGKLNDAMWQTAAPNIIRIGGSASTKVMFARDSEYLYVAIQAQRRTGNVYAPLNERRSRDPDLRKQDRVILRIDVDRDFQSCFEIALDYQGQVHDQLDGNKKWNPQIFVASELGKTNWSVEAAIPLSELAPQVRSSDHWGLSIERTSQNHSSSWPHRTDPRPFGLLQIQ